MYQALENNTHSWHAMCQTMYLHMIYNVSTHNACSRREKREGRNIQLSPDTTHRHGRAEGKGGAANFLWTDSTSLQGFWVPPEACPGFVRQTAGIIVKVFMAWTCTAEKWDCSGALRDPLWHNMMSLHSFRRCCTTLQRLAAKLQSGKDHKPPGSTREEQDFSPLC